MQRKAINALLRKSDLIQVEWTKRARGRQKISLVEVVKKEMLTKEVIEARSLVA